MRLVDRIAAWFGYVRTAPAQARACGRDDAECFICHDCDMCCECRIIPTVTTVVTPPQIIISADFKRGIPCS